MPLLDIRGIKKIYSNDGTETHALRGVSLVIREGEFVAVMGPSGSGKSTLLHVLGFLDRPTSGTYLFQDKRMEEYSDDALAAIRNTDVGFVFQSFNLLPRTSVMENVKLPLLYSDVPESDWNNMATEAIGKVGLLHRMDHEPAQLSGGEKQRVAIARALVAKPKIIFADEPTGNLDSVSGGQVMETIRALHAIGHTIVLITHETYTAGFAERIIRLKDGIIESDEKVAPSARGEFRK